MGRTIMNRWALQRYTVAGHLAPRPNGPAADRLRTARRTAGQTSFEYLGIAVVIAVIIGVLAGTTDIGDKIKSGITGSDQQDHAAAK